MFVLILFDFCRFTSAAFSAYTTLNELLALHYLHIALHYL